jgi:hypothetical protein
MYTEEYGAFISLAASPEQPEKKKVTLQSSKMNDIIRDVLPIKLDPATDHEYVSTFYPKNLNAKYNKPTRNDFSELLLNASRLSLQLNTVFDYLMRIVQANVRLVNQANGNISALERSIHELFDKVTAMPAADKVIAEAAKNFCTTIHTDVMHVIRESSTFKGGYDIYWLGFPAKNESGQLDTPTLNLRPMGTAGDNDFLPLDKDTYSQHHDFRRYYDTQLSRDIITVAQAALQYLGGGKLTDITTAHHRHIVELPLNFDFTKLNYLKTDLDLKLFPRPIITENMPRSLVHMLSKYFKLVLIRTPDSRILDSHIRHINESTDEYARQTLPPLNNEALYFPEYLALKPNLSVSLKMSLPKEIVHYITQTPSGEKPSMMALNAWVSTWQKAVIRISGMKAKRGGKKSEEGSVKLKDVPFFIVRPSLTQKINDIKKEKGLFIEQGKTNSDHIYVTNHGALSYLPKTDQLFMDNALAYERVIGESLEKMWSVNCPAVLSYPGLPSDLFIVETGSKSISDQVREAQNRVKKFTGKMISYNWDYNHAIRVSDSDASVLISTNLSGASVPDDLSITDFLRKPFAAAMTLMFPNSSGYITENFGAGGAPDTMLGTDVFKGILHLYDYLLYKHKVPNIQQLIQETANHFEIRSLFDEKVKIYEEGMYRNLFTAELQLQPMATRFSAGDVLKNTLHEVLTNATGKEGTNLFRAIATNGEDKYETGRYFDATTFLQQTTSGDTVDLKGVCTLAEFKNIYGWFGGYMFYLAMKSILESGVLDTLLKVDTEEVLPSYLDRKELARFRTYRFVCNTALPVLTMLTKYVPDSDAIMKRVIEIEEKNKANDAIDVEDIKVPGTSDKAEMFPHQVKAHKTLRNRPHWAVLDVAPGGGKTILLLSDAACCIRECLAENIQIRPIVLCPDKLIRNWVEDMQKISGSTWNMIPLNTKIFNRWGRENLDKILSEAPVNTIVVAGFDFLSSKKYRMSIGNHTEVVSAPLEFLQRYGFNYVAIDEVHKGKNFDSARHKLMKQLSTASHVKFVRLASGTLVPNEVSDIVGIAAMMSAQIFRTKEEYEQQSTLLLHSDDVFIQKLNKNQKTRKKLSNFAAVISIRRKEWAFMLPAPVESFTAIDLVQDGDTLSELHQRIYDAILEHALKELDEAKAKAKHRAKGDEEGEDDAGEAGGTDDDNADELVKGPSDDEDEDTGEYAAVADKFEYWLQRLEQCLTDPMSDPLAKEVFKDVDASNYVSLKVKTIVNLISKHFNPPTWSKGTQYDEYDRVMFEGKMYVARKLNVDDWRTKSFVSTMSPSDDTQRWKQEDLGKVLVFCRYKCSVDAIMRALPEELKKISRIYSGNEDARKKLQNLEDFKDPKNEKVKVLIAIEQGIQEGHNMQAASRIIRVECPWTPGEIDQAQSRIFRPDPSTLVGKEIARSVIYLDWVMVNGTLEVTKLARLYAKTVVNAQFDEADNPRYQDIMQYSYLRDERPRMSRETIACTDRWEDIEEPYIGPYTVYVGIRNTEFQEMKKKLPSAMIGLTQVAQVPGAKRMRNVPYVIGQEIIDTNDLGLINLVKFLRNEDNRRFIEDPQKLKGMIVHTDMGNGTIVKVTSRRGLSADEAERIDTEGADVISSIKVKIRGFDEPIQFALGEVYVANKLREDTMKFYPNDPSIENETVKRNNRRIEQQTEEELKRKEEEERKRKQGLLTDVRNNLNGPLPIVKDQKPIVTITPVVYNGWIGLEVEPTADNMDLSRLQQHYQFTEFGDYLKIRVDTFGMFNTIIRTLQQQGLTLPKLSLDLLKNVMAGFKDVDPKTKLRIFKPHLLPIREMTMFFLQAHKRSAKGVVKVYPLIVEHTLYLTIDLLTNPSASKLLGKSISADGHIERFEHNKGMHIIFARTSAPRKELGKILEQLHKDPDVQIPNMVDTVAKLRSLQYTPPAAS